MDSPLGGNPPLKKIEEVPWLLPTDLYGASTFLRVSNELAASEEESELRASQKTAWEESPVLARSAEGRLRRLLMQKSNVFVGLDGTLSAYKTTLITTLQTIGRDAVRAYPEPAARGNEVLALFYDDPPRFAEAMQFNALRLRFGIMHEIFQEMRDLKAQNKAALFVGERVWPFDCAFKIANEKLGRFSPEASKDYDALMNVAWKVVFVPNVFYFISVDPAVSHERIKTRGRGCEVSDTDHCAKCSYIGAPVFPEAVCKTCEKPFSRVNQGHIVCASCALEQEKALVPETPDVISSTCKTCNEMFLCIDGPVPLSYLEVLRKAQEEVIAQVVSKGYTVSCVDGNGDLSERDFLDTVDKFSDNRQLEDFDVQLLALEMLEAKAMDFYIKALSRIGMTREEVLEKHQAYIEAEDKKGKRAVEDT